MGVKVGMDDDIVNNELYDAHAAAKGSIPAVDLAGAPDSPPTAALVEAEAFWTAASVSAAGATVVGGAVSVVGTLGGDSGP